MSENNTCCSAEDNCCGEQSVTEIVKEYYGKTLQSNEDLLSGACCALDRPPAEIRKVIPSNKGGNGEPQP